MGPDGPTPEAVSAEAACGAILSSEDILIGLVGQIEAALLNRQFKIRDFGSNKHSEETWNKGDLTWRKGIIKLLKVCAILTTIFTWLALKIPWLTANMAPEIRGVTKLRSLP